MGRVTGGEWWRAVTALFLHADALHLAGNVIFGAAFGYRLITAPLAQRGFQANSRIISSRTDISSDTLKSMAGPYGPPPTRTRALRP